jgi:hypothetical protein
MGPGIFTTHWKKVLGGCLALLMAFLAVVLYYEFRSPVGRASTYEYVNAWGDEAIEVVADEVVYCHQTAPLQITIRNQSENGWIVPGDYRPKEWVLEIFVDGQWYSVRTTEKHIRWDYPSEDKTPYSGPSGIVKDGEEQTFCCYIVDYYKLPLKPGLYRVVFPDMEKHTEFSGTYRTAIAAEFEVLP